MSCCFVSLLLIMNKHEWAILSSYAIEWSELIITLDDYAQHFTCYLCVHSSSIKRQLDFLRKMHYTNCGLWVVTRLLWSLDMVWVTKRSEYTPHISANILVYLVKGQWKTSVWPWPLPTQVQGVTNLLIAYLLVF